MQKSTSSTPSPTPPDPVDLVVVGGGVIGLFTAIAAAKHGHTVTLVDQFDLPHTHGSSHGDSRIYRMAYSEPVYLDMMALALPLWKDLQSGATETLLVQTGCLTLARCDPDGTLPPVLQDLSDAYVARNLEHAVLDASAVTARFPQFAPPRTVCAVHVEDGGILFADRCLEAAIALAREMDVHICTPFRAARLDVPEQRDALLTLRSDEGQTVCARRCIVAPGGWLKPLAQCLLGVQVPCVASEETVNYYAPTAEDALGQYDAFSGMPTFIYFENEKGAVADNDTKAEEGLPVDLYGIPSAVVPGVKVASHFCGPILGDGDADLRAAEVRNERGTGGDASAVDTWGDRHGRAAMIERSVEAATRFVRECMPGLRADPIKSIQCLYTRTDDSHFVLDHAPGTEGRVVLAGGGSGHAFKMAPAMGECAVSLAFGEEAPVDLSELALQRLYEKTDDDRAERLKFR